MDLLHSAWLGITQVTEWDIAKTCLSESTSQKIVWTTNSILNCCPSEPENINLYQQAASFKSSQFLFPLGARDFSSAVSGFCQVLVGCYPLEQFSLPREYSVFDGSQCIVSNRKFKMRRRRESQISNSFTRQNNNFARA